MRKGILLASALLTLTVSSRIPAQTSHAALKKIAEFDLPGPPGKRFDYLTIDPDDHYLISAHLGAEQTYIIDHRTNKVVATVKRPGSLAWSRRAVECALDQAMRYTSEQRVKAVAISDGLMLYAADVADGGLREQDFRLTVRKRSPTRPLVDGRAGHLARARVQPRGATSAPSRRASGSRSRTARN